MRKEDQDKHVQAEYEVALGYKLNKALADAKMWEELANEYQAKFKELEADARDADSASMQAAFWRARAIELGASENEYNLPG